jgi:hypothetical protein
MLRALNRALIGLRLSLNGNPTIARSFGTYLP